MRNFWIKLERKLLQALRRAMERMGISLQSGIALWKRYDTSHRAFNDDSSCHFWLFSDITIPNNANMRMCFFQLNCCGYNNYTDFTGSPFVSATSSYPDTCCTTGTICNEIAAGRDVCYRTLCAKLTIKADMYEINEMHV